MVSSLVARALGVNYLAPPNVMAEYLARQAGVTVAADEIPQAAAEWLVGTAELLADHATAGMRRSTSLDDIAAGVATERIIRLRRPAAPAVLAVVAPEQVVSACPAKDLARVCRVLVGRHLPGFCRQILSIWARDGHVVPFDEELPEID